MITQDTTAERVLSEQTMGSFITDWQRERIHFVEVRSALRAQLVEESTDEFRSPHQIQVEAEYLAEELAELDDVDLDGSPGHRQFTDITLDWVRRERSQQRTLDEAKERVVDHATVLGADDFAIYGIGKYLERPRKGIARGDILEEVVETETRLKTVDEKVRKNVGNQIFYIAPGNVTAAVLTEGGITIDFKKGQTVFPTQNNSIVGASLIRDMRHFFVREEGLRVDTRHIDNYHWSLKDSLEFLRMERLAAFHGLAFGNIPEGPLFADTGDRANRTFLHMAGNRIRIAAQASLDTNYELDLWNKVAA